MTYPIACDILTTMSTIETGLSQRIVEERGLTSRLSRLQIATVMALALLVTRADYTADTTPVNGDLTDKSKDQPSEHLIGPVPCTEPMPWEPNYNGGDQEAGKSVMLASIKRPEPTPDRNQPECWIIVKDQTSGTIFEN